MMIIIIDNETTLTTNTTNNTNTFTPINNDN